jgi:multidrug resistance efflux pump
MHVPGKNLAAETEVGGSMATTLNAATGGRVLQVLHLPSFGSDATLNQRVTEILRVLGRDIAVQVVEDSTSLVESLDREPCDAIVVTHPTNESEAISSLDLALAFASHFPVIVLTDDDDEELAQRILAEGAVECLPATKMAPGQFELVVRRAVGSYGGVAENNHATQRLQTASKVSRSVPHVTRRELPRVITPASPVIPVHPNVLRRRSRGGVLLGAILLVAVGLGVHQFWTAFFRFHAYGVVVGRAIDVAAPWEGQIKYVHVEEGQTVRQGDLLVTTENLALCRELEALDDELAIANAELHSKVAELKWNASYFHDVNARTSGAYYETWGQLLHEREMVTKLRAAYERAQILLPKKAITIDDYEKVKYELRGRIKNVEKLTEAVKELRDQVDSAQGMSERGSDQLTPLHARISAINAKRERLRTQIAEGQLRSPVNGTVLRRNRFAGERCEAGQTIVTVVEETSERVVVYYPQKSNCIPEVGETVTLQLPPQVHDFACVVERVGDTFEAPPEQIARHYLAEEKLLPVHMRPSGGLAEKQLRLGAVVMLPRSHAKLIRPSF